MAEERTLCGRYKLCAWSLITGNKLGDNSLVNSVINYDNFRITLVEQKSVRVGGLLKAMVEDQKEMIK